MRMEHWRALYGSAELSRLMTLPLDQVARELVARYTIEDWKRIEKILADRKEPGSPT